VLQGIFSCAVTWGHVQSNPVVGVRKPSAKRQRAVAPPLALVERMRAQLLADRRQRDATLLVVLAYAGLRPQEALALPWRNVRDRTLLIDRAQSDEGLKTTKTGRTRSVRLLAPLAADLAAWRLASGRPDADELVFPKRGDGGLWRNHDWANWRRQVFAPAAAAAGAPGMRPYDLRHAFCSLLIAEGASVVEVARQAGHSPTMTLSTYAHVMADLDGSDRVSAEAAIRAAREAEVSEKCPPKAPTSSQSAKTPSVSGEPALGLEPRTSSLQVKCSAN
jgi:integrase